MSLSKQLYIIISIIFFMIFAGNFIISVKNTKEYLKIESITKAQDTATSLGMSLKTLLKDKQNPEIESIIRAIANRGFYKEIRLEDSFFSIKEIDLIKASKELDKSTWKITNVSIDKKIGKIELIDTSDLEKELLALENGNSKEENKNKLSSAANENEYNFIPNENYKNIKEITFNFTATNEIGKKIHTSSIINVNKILVQVTRDVKFDYIPEWFIKMIPLKLEEQSSEISNDWQTTAIIYVSANPGDAYAKLYEQVKSAIIYALIAFIISMSILFIFVQYILKPLKKIEKLANNIAIGKFETIEKLPWTTEIKTVALAMNDMSRKIESIINRLNTNLENITKKLSKDELTQLDLKQNFETDMKDMFIHKNDGYVFIVKIFELGNFAKNHTNKEVNDFIKKFANILSSTKVEKKLEISAYRFFGSEFAIIGKNFTYEDAKLFSFQLQKKFEELGNQYIKKDIVHIGATPFNPIGTTPQILEAATEAYEKATLIGQNEVYITDTITLARNMDEWKDLILNIVDNSKFDLKYIGNAYALDKSSNDIVMQEAFATIKDKDGLEIPIGTFVSIAERYEKIIDFDKKIITKVMNNILINKIKHDISINLSLASIANTTFILWLEKTILEHKTIASQLVFSITSYAVAKDVDKFKFFADEMHQCGAKIIIKRFESKFIPLNNIKDFNLDYIRLAREYTHNISNDASKQSFVEAIVELTHLLNIKLFAENVQEDEDLETIKKLGVYGASR
jgi:EAL domain-containing protein (putative c-di-GMP-specific phosphodiesterase class I)/methyl-accepting chemotaxis protein